MAARPYRLSLDMLWDRDRTGVTRTGGWLAPMLALLAAACALTSCAPAAPSTAPSPGPPRDAAQGPVIISLNPCLDAILAEVAAPDQVLALSHYSRDPRSSSIPAATAARFGVTGGTAEEVIALAPDLVLASSFIAPTTRSALERAGIRVETFGSPTTVDESIAQVRKAARLMHRGPEGEALVQEMRRAAEPVADARPVSTLLWQPGGIVPGEATLVAQMLRAKSFANHAAAMGLGQADFVALETVLADPPELLLVAGDSAAQRHPLLARLEDTRVEMLDPRLLFCGGRSVVGLGMRLETLRARLP
ncbi:iron complex transport system substrate-binding protein [Erythrobacter sanguineus]|uniref:Iron complex transport system substrate-binding protein n=1 Tax=Erythrobacter sanguineus TaxID=198312 RepID=A0A1M7SQB0_9SPHN|nr:iron complex transport system substrate-binding protein [Erythrobacter sanguineus]